MTVLLYSIVYNQDKTSLRLVHPQGSHMENETIRIDMMGYHMLS